MNQINVFQAAIMRTIRSQLEPILTGDVEYIWNSLTLFYYAMPHEHCPEVTQIYNLICEKLPDKEHIEDKNKLAAQRTQILNETNNTFCLAINNAIVNNHWQIRPLKIKQTLGDVLN